MANKQQTAVEWLYNHLFPKQLDGFSDEEWNKIDLAFKQAKQMEKENIKRDVYELCKLILSNPIETSGKTPKELFEQYYNETYKSESDEEA